MAYDAIMMLTHYFFFRRLCNGDELSNVNYTNNTLEAHRV